MLPEGAKGIYKRGRLLESSNSKRAVALSRAGSDTVEAFLQESGIERGSHKKERGALYNQYQRFCEEEERRSLTRNAFFKALRTKRFEERRLSDGRYFLINEGSNNQSEFMTIDNDSDIPF